MMSSRVYKRPARGTCGNTGYQSLILRRHRLRKTRPSHELSNAQIEHHYLSQHCFIDPEIFDRPNAELDAIPMYLLHGANDYVCPLSNAKRLKELFPQIKLEILEDAGHCAFSPKMAEGLCGATRRLAGLYGH